MIVRAAGEAGVRYVMSNIYGGDIQNPAVMQESMNGKAYRDRLADFEGLLRLPENDATPCVSDWKNKPIYINSFKISQRDMLNSLHRVLGTTDQDWQLDFEPTDQRFKRGLDDLKSGIMYGFPTASYARIFTPNGDGDFSSKWGTSNEVLGLPREDSDEVTKTVVEMIEGGCRP
ncbi:hypothetical protein LTR10_015228 [Elasticomyces elasticus]|uniref:NmrA-like domain-containing protein n=1 Tax=Exophiala sideris TaxID=1016849 RepID=A0ABR0JEU3_9EURO|nr:hypothetical protein LTR10_015228 [Elasticomyces elasticus]KAK5032703.1 hypothetical protein LTS07_004113 [Exophiala sideris]KAK5037117.1 hypothetical protein LTR13_004922 [Exophiala sideris]KAK5062227.1 hypothetical protein LTR69_004585 [Exophiala sideris]KAK5182275.1 hypothetical protein LTR44_005286 [Eurotiomycetes sp. CCFEE 6388]